MVNDGYNLGVQSAQNITIRGIWITAEGLTGGEKDDGFQTTVLGGIHMKSFELLHLLLKYTYVIHESDHSVRGHW